MDAAYTTSASPSLPALGWQQRLDSVYSASKYAAVLTGAPPIMLAGSVATAGLKLVAPAKSDDAKAAMVHVGLAGDALARGLVGPGGALNARAAATAPWLTAGSPTTGALGTISGVATKAAKFARIGVVSVTGALGAVRAAQAVQQAGSASALLTTHDGRGGALQAAGSALLLFKHPATLVAGGGLLLLGLVNDFALRPPATP